jgi:hypothetical protein
MGFVFNGYLTNEHLIIFQTLNILGIKVFKTPTFYSKFIGKIEIGKGLIIEKFIETEDGCEVTNTFTL